MKKQIKDADDFSKMKELFENLGISYAVIMKGSEGLSWESDEWNAIIILDQGIGYSGLSIKFYFSNEKYIGHGIWE